MNIIDLNRGKTTTVNVYQDYSELIANYNINVVPTKTQVHASHDFICEKAMYRDHESKGAAIRHAIDEVVRKVKLKREGKPWV